MNPKHYQTLKSQLFRKLQSYDTTDGNNEFQVEHAKGLLNVEYDASVDTETYGDNITEQRFGTTTTRVLWVIIEWLPTESRDTLSTAQESELMKEVELNADAK